MTTRAEKETIWRLRHLHGLEPKQIYQAFPAIPEPSIRRIYNTWQPAGEQTATIHPSAGKTEVTHDLDGITLDTTQQLFTNPDGTVEYMSDDGRIRTLGDLVRATAIDQTRWKIYHWKSNSWEGQMKGPDGEVVITTLHQVRALMKAHEQAFVETMLDAMREDIRTGYPPIPPPPPLPPQEHNRMLELSIPDMHFGKMALVEETGNNYNLEIAEQLFTAAITSLVEAALADGTNPELLVLPIGNDMFHVDNAYLTTFNRTPVDALHSVKQLFRRVKNLLRRTIVDLNTISPVEIIQVPGNHDKTISYFLSEALEDMFWNSSSINVRTTAMNRQYFAWRTVLLGYAHGDKPKRDRLPYLMAHEAPQLYAESKFREWHLGHTHTEQEEKYFPISTNEGMVCRTLPSLSAADAWHHDHGFNTAPRTAQALLWDEQIGLAATYYARLVPD